MDRGLLRWACVIAALIFALIWLLASIGTGFAAPAWIAPAGLLALAIAVALP